MLPNVCRLTPNYGRHYTHKRDTLRLNKTQGGLYRMDRDVKVNIRMAEDKKNELQMHADNYGMSMSALAAFVLGQWLYQQKHIIQPMIDEMKKSGSQLVSNGLANIMMNEERQ